MSGLLYDTYQLSRLQNIEKHVDRKWWLVGKWV